MFVTKHVFRVIWYKIILIRKEKKNSINGWCCPDGWYYRECLVKLADFGLARSIAALEVGWGDIKQDFSPGQHWGFLGLFEAELRSEYYADKLWLTWREGFFGIILPTVDTIVVYTTNEMGVWRITLLSWDDHSFGGSNRVHLLLWVLGQCRIEGEKKVEQDVVIHP